MTAAILPAPPFPQHARVTWHRPSVVVSFVLGLNIVLTPLKAYLCESFPWQIVDAAPSSPFSTWAERETNLLASYTAAYSTEVFRPQASYFHDVRSSTHVYRAAVLRPQHFASCRVDVLTTLTGGIFFAPAIEETICSFMMSPNASMVGGCFESRVFTSLSGTNCIWTRPGNELANASDARLFTYYLAYRQNATMAFMTAKLSFRLLLTLYLAYCLWRNYYRHAMTLMTQCAKLPEARHCMLLLGDPTSIALLNPVVSLCLAVDVWLSIDTVAAELVATVQVDDLWQFALGCVYLSRTVWFCYAFLAAASYCIHRKRWAHCFTPLDPTLVAIAAAFIAGPLTYFQAHSGFIEAYLYLFSLGASDPNSTEGAFPILAHPNLKRSPCISQRGADCFVFTFDANR
ncbi:hypothetical protein SPRG_02825 [Saprolegnia parasitica CBS 223.65]|uniref:Uncharacterized protein n=1 Tax=Saprolegnia parasitica (strain CBS 223.65) TaxID=695850 RepID=A0A067CZX2_SAPPC|nr:hypothetical protein SPRG_02825 [Saprolegnia parasitica CBS 223.65]KDO32347.1 hypothetical protein SPRG_02825 [Saprolegnia parasitica CBS 223.65]|eukprot:XP_012196802.1 hypothetical protein SPRG_02825 [Saprolegnia parasitica CBS 223.65]